MSESVATPDLPGDPAPAPVAPTVHLVPANRFFIRVIPLDPAADPAAQVEFYFERTAPFPLAQLAVGYLPSPTGRQALAYAAHRPRLEKELPAGWTEAVAVLPDVLVLALAAEATARTCSHAFDTGRWVAEWDEKSGWLSDLRAAASQDGSHRAGCGAVSVRLSGDGVELFASDAGEAAPAPAGRLDGARLRHADVRDAAEVAAGWRRRGQGKWLARMAVAGLVALVALVGAEATLRLTGRRATAAVSEALLRETAAWSEVADLAELLERGGPGPIDLLARVNLAKPAGITFHRVVAQSGRLTCEGTAPDEEAWQAFVTKARTSPGVTQVDVAGTAERFTLDVQAGGVEREGAPR